MSDAQVALSSSVRRGSGKFLVYGAPMFLSAALLFQIQPLVTQVLTPRFGGGAQVWILGQLFFQAVLLAGYLYAHALRRWSAPQQLRWHTWMLAAASVVLWTGEWLANCPASWPPAAQILGALGGRLGAVLVLMSATAPLIQRCYVATEGASPYRLYALSNAGSLLGLLTYPFLWEPWTELSFQQTFWRGGVTVLVAWFAWLWASLPSNVPASVELAAARRPASRDWWGWLMLAAIPSATLLAVTTQLSSEVASGPWLWVWPLALYLVTWIWAFDRPSWDWPGVWCAVGLVGVLVVGWSFRQRIPPLIPLAAGLLTLQWALSLLCHQELARRRPEPSQLTWFYLALAIGGVVGAIAVALVAPLLLATTAEFSLVCALGSVWWWWGLRRSRAANRNEGPDEIRASGGALVWVCTAAITIFLWLNPEWHAWGLSEVPLRRGSGSSGWLVALAVLWILDWGLVPKLRESGRTLTLGLSEQIAPQTTGNRFFAVRSVWVGIWQVLLSLGAIGCAYGCGLVSGGWYFQSQPGLLYYAAHPLVGIGLAGWGLWSVSRDVASKETRGVSIMSGWAAVCCQWGVACGVGVSGGWLAMLGLSQPQPVALGAIAGALIVAALSGLFRLLILPTLFRGDTGHRAGNGWWLVLIAGLATWGYSQDTNGFRSWHRSAEALALVVIAGGWLLSPWGTGERRPQTLIAKISWLAFAGAGAGWAWTWNDPRPVMMLSCAILAGSYLGGLLSWRSLTASPKNSRTADVWRRGSLLATVAAAVSAGMWGAGRPASPAVATVRSFYGVLKVEDRTQPTPERWLLHGRIAHGVQSLSPDRRRETTSYYHPQSGVGRLLERPRNEGQRVGVIGLGIGTVAAYGQPADEYCFIEIDAEVERLARRYFSFLSDARCRIRCVTGDGRVWLQEHLEEQFDVLVLDAFSGDVIPTHLLTAEAWDLYWERIRPGGFLAIHLSNIHFDLRPVINGHHQRGGFQLAYVDSPETLNHPRALWAIVSREPFELTELTSQASAGSPQVSWTDQWHPLWPLWRQGNQSR